MEVVHSTAFSMGNELVEVREIDAIGNTVVWTSRDSAGRAEKGVETVIEGGTVQRRGQGRHLAAQCSPGV